MHTQEDARPFILEDEIGLKLIAPPEDWQQRPDIFTPGEIENMAVEAGFKEIKIVSTKDLEKLYFSNRKDNLLPATGEIFLIAKV